MRRSQTLDRDLRRRLAASASPSDIAWDRFIGAFKRFYLIVRYSQEQPRVPAGNGRVSGQWVGDTTNTPRNRVRLAQSEEEEPFRIGGRTPEMSLSEAYEYDFAYDQRDMAVQAAQRIDPAYKPPAGLYETVDGAIRNVNAQRDDAKLFVINANRANLGLPPFPGSQLSAPTSPSIRNIPTEDILAPNGNVVGYRYRDTRDGIQTVNPDILQDLRLRLTFGADPIKSPSSYNGIWYSRGDRCVIGIRESVDNGETIDVLRWGQSPILEGLKVHGR